MALFQFALQTLFSPMRHIAAGLETGSTTESKHDALNQQPGATYPG
jgi:hypothetical protein